MQEKAFNDGPSGGPLERATAFARRDFVWVAQIVGLAAIYFGAAKLGLGLPVAHGNATPVWAPTGISLAALVIFGPRVWPGVALGAFVANATTPIPILAALAIGAGNTLEALFGAWLLRRVGFRSQLERVRDVIALAALAALVSTALSATVGVTALTLAGKVPLRDFGFSWSIWWFGDAMGDLLVAPLLLVWLSRSKRSAPGNPVEGLVLAALVVAGSIVVFFGGQWRFPSALFPLLIWAALRFYQRGTTVAVFIISGLALWAMLVGSFPIEGMAVRGAIGILQTLMGFVSVSMLSLAATITEREEVTAALRESERRSRAIFENSGVGVALTDLSGRYIETNRIYRDIVGYSADELERMSFVDITHEDDVGRNLSMFRELTGGKKDWFAIEKRYLLKGGGETWVRSTVSLVRDEHGNPRFAVAVNEDIGQRKQFELIRENFIASASHELRTPVTSIVGFTRLLSSNRLDERTRDEIIGHLNRQSMRLGSMVTHLLDLTAFEQGRLAMNPEPTRLALLVSRVVEATPAPPHKSVHVAVGDDILVFADPKRLEEVVTNLLTNAYRYGGQTIRIEGAMDDAGALISVTDDGPGIPADLVPSLFEPFSRGEEATAVGGSGLGLSIVRSLAEASGGEVRYESRQPHGSRFTVWLPRAR